MKKIITLTLFFLLNLSLNAAGISDIFHPKLKCISTQYFDLIYSPDSRESALRLSLSCDKIYETICTDYNTTPYFRIPVFLTPNTDTYNAYYANYAQNHIVLFDTVQTEDLAVFSNGIESCFTHELTHCVSHNLKNKFWRTIDKAGDIYNYGYYLSIPTLISEGATVSQESKTGEGRLNSGYFLHSAKQAKTDGIFPYYADITGARDTNPSSKASYEFGGMFAKYLQDTYGMDKYVSIWERSINARHLTYRGAFKKVYGKKLDTLWKEFIDSISIQDIIPYGTDDRFIPFYKKTGPENSDLLTCSDRGIAYLDKTSSSVYFAEYSSGKFKKPVKLFSKLNISRIRLNKEGTILTVSWADLNSPQSINRISTYNLHTKKWNKIKMQGLRDGITASIGDQNITVAVKTHSSKSSIIFLSDEGSILKEISFEKDAIPFTPVQGDNGLIYFILKKGMNSYICRHNFLSRSSLYDIVSFKEGIEIRYLNYTKGGLTFSYSAKDRIPCPGELSVNENNASVRLSTQQLSGGAFYTVKTDNKIVFTSKYYDETKLILTDTDSLMYETQEKQFEPMENDFPMEFLTSQDSADSTEKNIPEEKSYLRLFTPKGVIIPFSVVNTSRIKDTIFTSSDGLENEQSCFAGLSLSFSGALDTHRVILSAGWAPGTTKYGASAIISAGTKTNLLNFENTSTLIFDKASYSHAKNNFVVKSTFSTGNVAAITLMEENTLFHGTSELADYKSDFFYNVNKISLTWSHMKKYGYNITETGGISFSLAYKDIVFKSLGELKINVSDSLSELGYKPDFYHNLYPYATVKIPRILPFEIKNVTLNLPVSLTAELIPSYSTFLSLSASAVLFSGEIQKGLSFAPLYFRRLTIHGLYKKEYSQRNHNFEIAYLFEDFEKFDTMYSEDLIGLAFTLDGTYNAGIVASSLGVRYNFTWSYNLSKDSGYKHKLSSGFSISL